MTCDPGNCFLDSSLASAPGSYGCGMGSVGSLVEKQDLTPVELRAVLGGSRGFRQPDGLLRKGPSQRELFSYLHSARKEPRAERKHQAPGASRDYESDRENRSPDRYSREHHRGADFSKSSLPERSRFDKVRPLGAGLGQAMRLGIHMTSCRDVFHECIPPTAPEMQLPPEWRAATKWELAGAEHGKRGPLRTAP